MPIRKLSFLQSARTPAASRSQGVTASSRLATREATAATSTVQTQRHAPDHRARNPSRRRSAACWRRCLNGYGITLICKLPWAAKWRQLLGRMKIVFSGAVTNSRMRGMRPTTVSRLPHASTMSNISKLSNSRLCFCSHVSAELVYGRAGRLGSAGRRHRTWPF